MIIKGRKTLRELIIYLHREDPDQKVYYTINLTGVDFDTPLRRERTQRNLKIIDRWHELRNEGFQYGAYRTIAKEFGLNRRTIEKIVKNTE